MEWEDASKKKGDYQWMAKDFLQQNEVHNINIFCLLSSLQPHFIYYSLCSFCKN